MSAGRREELVVWQRVSQFTRDYRRMFGLRPRPETAIVRCGEKRSKARARLLVRTMPTASVTSPTSTFSRAPNRPRR
jgi:hypothetical protein